MIFYQTTKEWILVGSLDAAAYLFHCGEVPTGVERRAPRYDRALFLFEDSARNRSLLSEFESMLARVDPLRFSYSRSALKRLAVTMSPISVTKVTLPDSGFMAQIGEVETYDNLWNRVEYPGKQS